ncbi:MAG TPA: class I adenylate-forming enzyme family protein [Allosphingosinicella sp.]|nr:class I adenylate-forming enzyme family protein [Allosphingosinicella sp.]
MSVLAIALAILAAYLLFVIWRLGLHQRLPLAFSHISLEKIPDRAAKLHGDAPLFTCDTPVPWRVESLGARYPDDHSWSALRIRDTAAAIASMLRHEIGVGEGERVAILKANHFDIHLLTAGAVRAGAIACPLNGRFAADKVEPYLSNVGAAVLFSDSATLVRVLRQGGTLGPVKTVILAEPAAAASPEDVELISAAAELRWIEPLLATAPIDSSVARRGGSDPVYLTHSSGTTGFPKAVILRNGAQSHAVRGWLCYVHLSRRDRGYVAVPNNHQAVILSFNSMLLLGLPVHWSSSYGMEDFDPERVIAELAEGGYTGFFGFPITYTQMKEVDLAAHDLSRMRFWASTADAAHEAIQRPFVALGGAFKSLGLPLRGSVYLDAQGSSEVGTPSVIRYITPLTRRFGRRIGRVGSAPFGPQVRITRHGGPVRRGEAGRLEVKGRTVFNGYWNNHALTYEAIRDDWFFTGDIARQERDGNLVQLDREVDVIHTRAGQVYSLPIEERLHYHPAVFDICVYGARQADGSQRPAAAVAVRPGFDIDERNLEAELNELLGPEEQLERVEIVDWRDFPVGITGKTLKRTFRERTETGPVTEQNRPVGFRRRNATQTTGLPQPPLPAALVRQ